MAKKEPRVPIVISNGKLVFISEEGEDYMKSIEKLKVKQRHSLNLGLAFLSLAAIIGAVLLYHVFTMDQEWKHQTLVAIMAFITASIGYGFLSNKKEYLTSQEEKENQINLLRQQYQQEMLSLEKLLAQHHQEMGNAHFQEKLDTVCNIPVKQEYIKDKLFKK